MLIVMGGTPRAVGDRLVRAMHGAAAGVPFPPVAERRFREAHIEQALRGVQVWQGFLLALAALFGAAAVLAPRPAPTAELVLRFALLLPAQGALVWAVLSFQNHRRYPAVAPLLVPICAIGFTILMSRTIAEGRGEALAALTTNLLGVFLFSGLLFRQALLTSLAVLGTFLIAAPLFGLAAAKIPYHAISLAATLTIGGFVAHGQERAARTAFLEREGVRAAAASDALTGLANRRAFDEHLERLWRQGGREGLPHALLLIDVDHFKAYNDALGHLAGDEALRAVARVIAEGARRPLDLAARFGGEEFVLLLYGAEGAGAMQVAANLRAGVEALAIAHPQSSAAPVLTVSVGVASLYPAHEHPAGPDRLVAAADRALYAAKRSGRNAVRGAEADRERHEDNRAA